MRAEKEKRVKHSEYQRERANKRWEKDECRGNAGAMPVQEVPLEDENINSIDSNNNLTIDSSNLIDTAWRNWKKYKKAEFNFKYKSTVSEDAAKKELLNLCRGDPALAIKIIEQSIANGWKGLFKLRDNGKDKQPGVTEQELADLIARKHGVDARQL
jgi:hypothetical protein